MFHNSPPSLSASLFSLSEDSFFIIHRYRGRLGSFPQQDPKRLDLLREPSFSGTAEKESIKAINKSDVLRSGDPRIGDISQRWAHWKMEPQYSCKSAFQQKNGFSRTHNQISMLISYFMSTILWSEFFLFYIPISGRKIRYTDPLQCNFFMKEPLKEGPSIGSIVTSEIAKPFTYFLNQ